MKKLWGEVPGKTHKREGSLLSHLFHKQVQSLDNEPLVYNTKVSPMASLLNPLWNVLPSKGTVLLQVYKMQLLKLLMPATKTGKQSYNWKTKAEYMTHISSTAVVSKLSLSLKPDHEKHRNLGGVVSWHSRTTLKSRVHMLLKHQHLW